MKSASIRLLIICTSVTLVLLSVMGYLLYTGNRMTTFHAPLVDAAKGIKLEATLAHLWFEEIVSGDRHEHIETVWEHIEQADWYAKAMLNGGTNAKGTYFPLEDVYMRQAINEVRVNLANFYEIAEKRYANRDLSFPGTDSDQEFDKVFDRFMKHADQVETLLQDKIKADLSSFRQSGGVLLLVSMIMSTLVTAVLFRHNKRNEGQIKAIHRAHDEIKIKNVRLDKMAHYDFLTNLPNRLLFCDLLTQSLAQAKRMDEWVVLFFVDLDHFKSVNDSLGHGSGDRLLEITAQRLSESVGAANIVSRLSGDEFTVLLSHERSCEDALDTANKLAQKIIDVLSQRYVMENSDAFATASVGIALYPRDGKDPETLLRNADTAMYHVKQNGKNGFRFFSDQLDQEAHSRLQLELELRDAITNNELTLYYQPQWNLCDGSLYGLEVLIRWVHPVQGIILPDAFIPIAESCGLINEIDLWVVETACAQFQQWRVEKNITFQLAINLSASQFTKPEFVRDLDGILSRLSIDPKKIELEITESVLMADTLRTMEALLALKSLGVKLAIDDFGTGYSSMAYLRKFPIDTLKIDREFIKELGVDPSSNAIVEGIIKMANRLGKHVVAEGIETDLQNSFLTAQHCSFGQGFLFDRPANKEAINLIEIQEKLNFG